MHKSVDRFSFMAIVRVLSLLRAKEANLRHRRAFYWRYFEDGNDPILVNVPGLDELLPPRRQWARPDRKHRGTCGVPIIDVLHDSIYRKVDGVRRAGRLDKYDWGRRLVQFVEAVQGRVARKDFQFARPKLWLRAKAVPRGSQVKCRCICCYEDLSDRVILAIANKWLSSMLDPSFSDCSYAFRQKRSLTYHTAIKGLAAYRKRHDGRLYVAECDVLKCFDVISHDAVRQGVQAHIGADTDLMAIVNGYLASYDLAWMKENAVALARESGATFDGVDTRALARLFGSPIDLSRFGIPQGGSLSGTLTNMILDAVDKALAQVPLTDLFYARYCDDIIISHPTRKGCLMAQAVCRETLASLKIPAHPRKRTVNYDASYYAIKSKGPYAWASRERNQTGVSPWVSFLGCCIRYDGEMRVRAETVDGHVRSMREECETVLSHVRRGVVRKSVSVPDIATSLMYRLVDKGVGRITAHSSKSAGRCWMAAFPYVWSSKCALHQMRLLDAERSSLFAKVMRTLEIVRKRPTSDEDDEESLYFGKPFSYYGVAERIARDRVARMRKLILLPKPLDGEKGADDQEAYDCAADCDEEADRRSEISGWDRASGR